LQFPSKLYYAARALTQPFNELVDAIARQPDWLFEVLERLVMSKRSPPCLHVTAAQAMRRQLSFD
jgi:hypothetical protein